MDLTPGKLAENQNKCYKKIDDQYMLKINYIEEDDIIDLICYILSETDNKRYEINLRKVELNSMNNLFKIYDNNKEIFEILVKLFESNKYKVINSSEKMSIELYFVIMNNNVNISLELNVNLNGDFRDDYNFMLKNEIIELKKKFSKEINDLKKENKSINKELNEIKEIINNLCKNNKSNNNNITNSIIKRESKNNIDNDNAQNLLGMANKKKDTNLDINYKK